MQPDRTLHPSRRTVLRLSLGLLALPGIARAAPLRVVTLFQGASDTAVALGVTPCGVVDSWSEKPMYRYLRPALAAVPHVGLETQPSLEDIVLLKPDLIVASRFRHQRIAPLLEQISTVLMLEEVFEFKRTLAMMGAALQRQQLAIELLGQWQQRVAALRGQLQAKFTGRWPITVSVLDIREDHIRSYLPASFAGSVLSELGFAWTPAARQATGVSLKLSSKESLPVVDADLFFVFQRADSTAAQHTYDKLVQNPFWQQLRAVRDGQVWRVDAVAWSLSGGILGANRMLDEIARVALADSAS
ncbi:ABC transporter substrate-binding protein [Pseudomonas syringae]|uniref:Iron-siderophore ABC transporter substrate-binding protein n=1 Tax=Pseudomonas syringae pv. papulans TaxID=83963 RepID=A0A0P9Y810_PSESX|nr:iron-siderophore ABC transporter substrate-binding protein [Pseudomonas syringae]KPY29507.1 Achromobactin ABC-type transport system, periplasmic substrate-binding protein [Pseudomonas syringae pv. papulans]KWS42707.1 achromobactin-binding protein [Pseudomonas syringae pv. papulans]MDH4601369.1 iron-siderophore ABC transporter substrate-binding protein [Pseudomonas syringae pv. papulans]MDH4622916.1 iron-siderophore ABC transporter substrate-binding protein [Pseudomonas syringae pv. papulans]